MKLINKILCAAGLLLAASQASAISVPGTIRVGYSCSGTSCSTVQVMSMQTYVKRGLNDEWIASWHQESLRAGAVAYRSYGAWHVSNPLRSNYDICNTTSCQVNDTDTSIATDQATDATNGMVVSRDGKAMFRAEYSSQNNAWDNLNDGLTCNNKDLSCGNGNNGSPATGWPCLSDSVGYNKGCFGHGRGMSQWGSQYWAANHGRDWRWIADHYFNANNKPSGNRSAFIYGPDAAPAKSAPGTITGYGNLCVDIEGGITADGTEVQLWTCNGNNAQQWRMSNARELRNPLADKCMVLGNGGAAVDGAPIWEWTCGGQADQKWLYKNMQIVAGNSGKCIDVPQNNLAAGQALQLWDCNDTNAQKFTFEPATGELKTTNNLCVDVRASSISNGTVVQLWACNGTSAQRWIPGNGGFRTAVNTNNCLDIDANQTVNGTKIQTWSCIADGAAQQFALRGQIENAMGKCLDIPRANAQPGQSLQLWACAGNTAQRWSIWQPR